MLKAIIDYECKKTGLTTKQFLSAADLSAIRDNFYQIRGLYHDRYWINLLEIVQLKGEFFLQPDETKHFEEIPKDHEEERADFLMSCVAHKLNPIWWFVVSLSRCLQSGEHTIKPVDAYWLGLVDEVIGSDLPCVRDAYEKFAQQQMTNSGQSQNTTPAENNI